MPTTTAPTVTARSRPLTNDCRGEVGELGAEHAADLVADGESTAERAGDQVQDRRRHLVVGEHRRQPVLVAGVEEASEHADSERATCLQRGAVGGRAHSGLVDRQGPHH